MGNNLAKLVLVAGLAGVSLGSVGCSDVNFSNFFEEQKRNSNEKFYACNYWIDDGDGAYNKNECVGVKDNFRANESVTLIAEIDNQKGSELLGTVLNGNGQVVRQKIFEVGFNDSWAKIEFEPGELYELGGEGEYTAKWSIRGTLIGIKNFKLIK
jgi:hypothetical protein